MKRAKSANLTSSRLQSRPATPVESGPLGLYALGLAGHRDGWLAVPPDYHPEQPLPLILMLHGAGGNAIGALAILQQVPAAQQVLLLAVDSRQLTWDIIRGNYGPDIRFIDQALAQTFRRYEIAQDQIAIAGFSDGASYALSVGLANGDLFTHILAFSPGFMIPADRIGSPRIFMSHGQQDDVLPIDRCSRRLAPQLERDGYDLQYQEFEGSHTVPTGVVEDALAWFAAK